jgi:hypothetical protein
MGAMSFLATSVNIVSLYYPVTSGEHNLCRVADNVRD